MKGDNFTLPLTGITMPLVNISFLSSSFIIFQVALELFGVFRQIQTMHFDWISKVRNRLNRGTYIMATK